MAQIGILRLGSYRTEAFKRIVAPYVPRTYKAIRREAKRLAREKQISAVAA